MFVVYDHADVPNWHCITLTYKQRFLAEQQYYIDS